MYDEATRRRALDALAAGRSLSAVSRDLGVSRAAIRGWRDAGADPVRRTPCPVCDPACERALGAPYAALFGYYLGDGYVSRQRSTYSLRVSCDRRYPGIIADVSDQMVAVRGRGPVGRVGAPGCVVVCGYWNHWPCLFPQHGSGRKHTRALTMAPWQRKIVGTHPADFLRGLFHSDGCRVDNWATTHWAGGKVYSYGRWQFVNHSEDIRRWCGEALDLLGIPWRQSSWKTISVSTKSGVAALDAALGPKR